MDKSTLLKIIGVLISIQVISTVAAGSETTTESKIENKKKPQKCNELPNVRFENEKTCPSEGNFTLLLDDEPECGLFVTCSCQGGRMTSRANVCENENATFSNGECIVKPSKDTRCHQTECKKNEVQEIMDYTSKHNCPKVVIEGEDEHSHEHGDDHEHHHQSTTTSVPHTNLSYSILPFIHTIILMAVSSLLI